MTGWADEERAQATELTQRLQGVIDDYGKEIEAHGRQPILNAVAGALVTLEGGLLASIEDLRFRKALRKAMERARPEAIAKARLFHGYASVIKIGGPKH